MQAQFKKEEEMAAVSTPTGEITLGIGLGFVPNDAAYTAPGTRLAVRVRSREVPVVVTKPPFHKQKAS